MSFEKEQSGARNNHTTNFFLHPSIPWIVLGISLMLTFVSYHISNEFVRKRAEDKFTFRAKEIEKSIKKRLKIYEDLLWSGVGMIYTHDKITREQFAKFVSTINIERHWPGIQAIGYSVPVKPEDKNTHIRSVRAEGFPEFTIKPEGDREIYSSIIFIEPFDWRNQRAFGYDMWSNGTRREAMRRAMEQGAAATSGMITLVQETDEDVQRGFLTYVPVYKSKNIPEDIQKRQNQFIGWVYAAFRVENLMKGIINREDPNIEFEIFDSKNIDKEALLFDSNDIVHLEEKSHHPSFRQTLQVENQGHTWTIYLNTPNDYSIEGAKGQPRFIAVAGIIVNILLFYVIFSLRFIHQKAESIAQDMTRELQLQSAELETTKKSLELKVNVRTKQLKEASDNLERQVAIRTKELEQQMEDLEIANQVMVGREIKMIALKEEIEKLKKRLAEKS